MENKSENESFNYTYSAKEQAEVKKIRQKYMSQEPDKMTQLRKLDQSVNQKGTTVALIVGIVGALIMGIGMCCCMVWGEAWFIPGVVIGVIGIAIISVAYPLYNHVIRKEREKIAPEILRLTDELMK